MRPKASRFILVAFLFALVGCASTGPDSARSPSAPPSAPAAFSEFEWPDGPEFRSAGRLRALGLQGEGGVDPVVERAQLRAHFDVVLGWLEAREAESIATARARLEATRGAVFDDPERRAVERDLRAARQRQLDVLERYARRGQFPLHPVPGAAAEPIFVDAEGTACAVGHLMRADGWEREVEAIRSSHNGVYVPDLESGPVLAWVATSGLLIEEAAVIQPTYTPPPAPGNVDLTALSAPGASATASGLRIDQLSAIRTTVEYTLPSGITPELLAFLFPGLSIPDALARLGTQPIAGIGESLPLNLDDIRLFVGQGYSDGNGGLLEGVFDGPSGSISPLMFWNAGDAGGFLASAASSASSVLTEIRFDVSPSSPAFGIDAAYFEVVGTGFWDGTGSSGTELLVEMEVRSRSGDLLAAFSSESESPFGFMPFDDTAAFAPQAGVSVIVRGSTPAFASSDAFWGQFRQDFRIVPIPEPSLALLIALGLGGLAVLRHGSSNRG